MRRFGLLGVLLFVSCRDQAPPPVAVTKPAFFDLAPVPSGPRTQFRHDTTQATKPAEAALLYAGRHTGLDPDALATAYVALVHDLGHGAIVVKLEQRVGGVDVAHTAMSIVMNRNLDLVAITGQLSNAAKP